ncbi:hypothetical protein M3661_03585 [Paenibacillus sp. MER 180]|uniref:hypothetical protein n=1 Tax=Paenibacillus sp. MER 180 TaxID=2939570 RepID=UPI0020423248|nr:hypothetical protein [Paenibacillus sp. MER 180]MCM3289206.1 hypothetical protein [Paenibacillus sp. MER 180]
MIENEKIKRYYKLKQQQKEIEDELSALRSDIIQYCEEQGESEIDVGNFHVRLVQQQYRQYDDAKLYAALPDPEVWRLLSKPDTAKIKSLIQLGVISDESISDTYSVHPKVLLHVDKK